MSEAHVGPAKQQPSIDSLVKQTMERSIASETLSMLDTPIELPELDPSVHPLDDWRFVDQMLCRIAKKRHELDALEARWLREAVRLKIWKRLGYVSIIDYMERRLGYGPRAAQERLRTAKALGRVLPLEHALEKGDITYSNARELTRIVTNETAGAWLSAVKGMNQRQVEELLSGHAAGDLPSDPKNPDIRTYRISFEVSAATFAGMREAQRIINSELGEHVEDDVFLQTLVERALDPAEPDRPRHQIAVTVCEECKRGWEDGAIVELADPAIERACCDCDHIDSLDADEPVRLTTSVPLKIRRLVFRRDHGRCRVPGCRASRALDIHHIHHREHGGTHDPKNLLVLCSAHHRAVHEGILRIHGHAKNACFTRHIYGYDVPDTLTSDCAPEPMIDLADPQRIAKIDAAYERWRACRESSAEDQIAEMFAAIERVRPNAPVGASPLRNPPPSAPVGPSPVRDPSPPRAPVGASPK